MADQDVEVGQVKQVEGRVQNAVGNVTGDVSTQANGAAKQVEGKIQEGWGNLKDDVRNANDRNAVDNDATTVSTTRDR